MNGSKARNDGAASAPFESLPLFSRNSASDFARGELNDDLLVRAVITDAIKRSKKSREQIADEMRHLLGLAVTARMITAFTSESKELHRWPGAWDRAFCVAVGDGRLMRCRIELAGCIVITAEEQTLLELGRQYLRRKRAGEEAELLEKRLAGVDL